MESMWGGVLKHVPKRASWDDADVSWGHVRSNIQISKLWLRYAEEEKGPIPKHVGIGLPP